MIGVVQHLRQIIGEVAGGVDHEIDNAVVFFRQQLTQYIFVLGVRFEIRYVWKPACHIVKGNAIHLIPHFRKTRHQIFAHRARRTEN